MICDPNFGIYKRLSSGAGVHPIWHTRIHNGPMHHAQWRTLLSALHCVPPAQVNYERSEGCGGVPYIL